MASSFEDTSLKGIKVVVADDDDVTRTLLRQLLKMCHLNVVGDARDGKQALETYRKLRPRVICLDVQMPEMSGLEVLTAIRADPTDAAPRPVVIMITGTTTSDIVKSAIAAGADGIIAKPFSAGKIFQEISRCIQRAANKGAATPKA